MKNGGAAPGAAPAGASEVALSVVIPAYNESGRLGPSLERVLSYLDRCGRTYEVMVVDDGSSDGTAELAARFAARFAERSPVQVLRQERNRGKGAALRRGVLASRGARVLLCDADLSTPIENLERLEPALATAELVFGSRAAAGAHIVTHQPGYREWMGKTFNRLIRLLGVGGVADTQCGFKLLDGAAARVLFAELTVERFAYDVELLWLARRRGYRVAEVGVEWANSADSRVHPLFDSSRMLWDVIALRWRHLRRRR